MYFKTSMYHIILRTSQLYFCLKKKPKWFSHWYRLIVFNKKKRKKEPSYLLIHPGSENGLLSCLSVCIYIPIFLSNSKKIAQFFFTLCNRKFVSKLHDQQSHYFFLNNYAFQKMAGCLTWFLKAIFFNEPPIKYEEMY